jgi:RNA polymerase sigma-70 factor (ECF subfamily)
MATPIQKNTVVEPDPARWLQDYGDTLFRYALQRLHNTAQAEDVVQETLLAALQARASYTGRSSEKTWLIGILKHKIIDLIRKQVRESAVDDIHSLSDAVAESGVDELFDARGHWIHPPQDWGNPDKALHTRQFMEILERCLERLKPAQAQIFSLKELAGQSIDEICKELGITATNCSVLLYRARMGLRRCLEVRLADDNPGER